MFLSVSRGIHGHILSCCDATHIVVYLSLALSDKKIKKRGCKIKFILADHTAFTGVRLEGKAINWNKMVFRNIPTHIISFKPIIKYVVIDLLA